MNASTTFDSAAAIAEHLCNASHGVKAINLTNKTTTSALDASNLAYAFPSTRKADVCRLLAEAMKEKANRTGLSATATLTKALESARGFSDLELASLKAFWTLAVVSDSAVNGKAKAK